MKWKNISILLLHIRDIDHISLWKLAWSLNPEMFFSDDYNQVSSLSKLIQSGQNWKLQSTIEANEISFRFTYRLFIAFDRFTIHSFPGLFKLEKQWHKT